MNWEVVGATAEALSALAVLATLLYLSLQVRDTRKQLQVNAHQARTDRNIQMALARAQDPTYEAILAKERRGEALAESELVHAGIYWGAAMRHFEDLHYQRQAGTIDDDTWEANVAGIRQTMGSTWGKLMWEEGARNFRKPFIELVERIRKGGA